MKGKKIVAPILITIFICVYYVSFAFLSIYLALPLLVKILGIGIPLVFVGVCVYVLVERIKEIRSGEEDDLSKY